MRNRVLPFLVLLTLVSASSVCASVLYDNTVTDTGDTLLFSVGPYVALGDQVHLVSSGKALQAQVQMYNNGGGGTFDAELDFFAVGSPLGAPLGSAFLTSIPSAGSDVLNLTFSLGTGINVPQDLIWTVSVSSASPGMDLGVDFYEQPAFGSSDNTFMIAATTGPSYSTLPTNSENVYFGLTGTLSTSTPEPTSLILLASGLLVMFRVPHRLRRSGQVSWPGSYSWK